MFDWSRFLERHNIDYVTRGPNVARNHIAVRCPFCGSEDPSHHMGISLDGEGWGCLRQREHRGRSAARLVQALLRCSSEEARRVVGYTTYIPEDFLSQVQSRMIEEEIVESDRVLELSPDFKDMTSRLPSSRPFRDHLRTKRYYTDGQIDRFTKDYGLRYCTKGAFKGRIIFPIYVDGQLVSWTGRTIYEVEQLRYKNLTVDPEKAERDQLAPGIMATNQTLLWYDDLLEEDADILYLVEGPFDGLRVRVLGRDHGITATCLFTNHPTGEQVNLLHRLLPRFRRKHVLLDQEMLPTSIWLTGVLAGLGATVRILPRFLKDPGELRTAAQLLELGD